MNDFPPPIEWIRECHAINPDYVQRVYRLQEREMTFRHVQTYLGLATGLLISFAFLGTSAWLIVTGHEVSGTVLGTVDLVALATVFVTGRPGSARPDPAGTGELDQSSA